MLFMVWRYPSVQDNKKINYWFIKSAPAYWCGQYC